MIRFVILSAPRTGSNLLCTLLQSHSDVLCHHELFNPADIFCALPLRRSDFSLGSTAERDADPLGFLAGVWARDLGHRTLGFKMTHWQQPEVLDRVCADPEIYKLVLHRKDRLKTFVSSQIAKRRGVWELYDADSPLQPGAPVHVDYEALQQALVFDDRYYAYLDETIRGPRLDLWYGSLFDPQTHAAVIDFLGLIPEKLRAGSRQQNPRPVAALISNVETLRQQLACDADMAALSAELGESVHRVPVDTEHPPVDAHLT